MFGTLVFAPVLALAQQAGNFNANQGLGGFLTSLKSLMNLIVPILIGIAVIAFLYGVLKFVFNAGNEEARKTGRDVMIWGIVGIVVMVSVWGLVGSLQTTFGLQNGNNGPQNIPRLPQ